MARSSGAHRLAAAMSLKDGKSFEDAYREVTADGAMAEDDGASVDLSLQMILAWDGNLAELVDDNQLTEIGTAVVREFELDDAARKDWKECAKRALDMAAQKPKGAKAYPFDKASNVQYPLLTTASMQFAARAYPAIVRGDEVLEAKALGEDAQGEKANRAQRTAAFSNDQLIYTCTEWEPGTDMLLHALPVVGSAFRKVYYDAQLKRPRLDYVSALDVAVPMDAPSLDLAPRITHEISKYPYEIEMLMRGEDAPWLECEYTKDSADAQKPVKFLEQCRYIDLDGDGLSEPYIVTVEKEKSKVVRIDPAFDEEDIYTDQQGNVTCIKRVLPWVDYTFLPDTTGGVYGIGFGKLLESIGAVIDTTINELIDAGHLANTNTGFIGAGVKARGGDMEVRVNSFRMLPGVTNVKDAIHRLEFPGPNAVLFNLLEFLIDTAKDITSVKDVLTGDAPGQQPATSTLALIEQGLQVFTAIYKRIYRSMTREFEALYRLNQRYLSEEEYTKFLDTQPPQAQPGQAQGQPTPPQPQLGHNGGPPMMPGDMGPVEPSQAPSGGEVVPFPGMPEAAQNAPQAGPPNPMLPMAAPPPALPPPGQAQAAMAGQLAPMQAQRPVPAQDFDLSDMDIRPVADPTAVTEMQRLAKVNALYQLYMNNPIINQIELAKRALAAMRIPEPEKLVMEQNPMLDAQAQANMRTLQAQAAEAEAKVGLVQAQTQTAMMEPQLRQAEMALTERQIAQKDMEIQISAEGLNIQHADLALREHDAALREADSAAKWDFEDRKLAASENQQAHDQAMSQEDFLLRVQEMLRQVEESEADRQFQREEGDKNRSAAKEDKTADREHQSSEGDKTRAAQKQEKAADRTHQASEGDKNRSATKEDKAADREHQSSEGDKTRSHQTSESGKDRSLQRESGDKEREHKSSEGDKERSARSKDTETKAKQAAKPKATVAVDGKEELTRAAEAVEDSMLKHSDKISEALMAFAEAVKKSSGPKELIRDANGRAIGVRTVEEG